MSKLIDARKNSEIDDDDVCEIAKVEEYWRVGGGRLAVTYEARLTQTYGGADTELGLGQNRF